MTDHGKYTSGNKADPSLGFRQLRVFFTLSIDSVLTTKVFRLQIWTAAATTKSCQLCLTLCNTIDGSPPGSPVPGILQARTLEWVAISFSNA